ncbi:PREDICTED: uncharacterized protein LOC109468713 [Branchiostoma belcheri]|uniref:Uncharacterized protein LOC109468713 n=1 Tax=Branchiostoma belcheri TaxID=7741 RepID=A0A6P4YDS2_BRABE|nr:PREDICTED: uncharacterized protein LOC109468713 [Branchiostoma belcheri]
MAGNEDPFRGTLDNAQRAGLPRPDEEASDEEMEALEPPQANIVPRANTRRGPGDYTRQMVLINIFQLEGNTAPRTNDNQIVRVVINQALTSGQLLARIKEGFLDPNRVNVRAAERRKIERASLSNTRLYNFHTGEGMEAIGEQFPNAGFLKTETRGDCKVYVYVEPQARGQEQDPTEQGAPAAQQQTPGRGRAAQQQTPGRGRAAEQQTPGRGRAVEQQTPGRGRAVEQQTPDPDSAPAVQQQVHDPDNTPVAQQQAPVPPDAVPPETTGESQESASPSSTPPPLSPQSPMVYEYESLPLADDITPVEETATELPLLRRSHIEHGVVVGSWSSSGSVICGQIVTDTSDRGLDFPERLLGGRTCRAARLQSLLQVILRPLERVPYVWPLPFSQMCLQASLDTRLLLVIRLTTTIVAPLRDMIRNIGAEQAMVTYFWPYEGGTQDADDVVQYCRSEGTPPLMVLLGPRGHTQMIILQRFEDTVPTGVAILEGISNGQLYMEAIQRDRQRILESRRLREDQDAEILQQLGTDQVQGRQQPETTGQSTGRVPGHQQPETTGQSTDRVPGHQQPETTGRVPGHQQPETTGQSTGRVPGHQQPETTGQSTDRVQGRQHVRTQMPAATAVTRYHQRHHPYGPQVPGGHMPRHRPPGGNMPRNRAPVGNMPQHQVMGGNMPRNRAPVGNMPQHQVMGGNMPRHRAPVGNMPLHRAPVGNMPRHRAQMRGPTPPYCTFQ